MLNSLALKSQCNSSVRNEAERSRLVSSREIEGQLWLMDNVDRGLMEIEQLGCMTKKGPHKIIFHHFFTHTTVLVICQQIIPKTN